MAEAQLHLPCPACPSSDAFSIFEDGSAHCFSCGKHWNKYSENGGNERLPENNNGGHKGRAKLIDYGEYQALSKRGITEETCRKYGYQVGEHKGKPCHIAPYYDSQGHLVAQKVRYQNKDFRTLGDISQAGLFGSHIGWKSKRRIVITEGEIDALSMAQVQGCDWPCVSIPNGAEGAPKAIAKNLDWLNEFKEIVLMFDQDEPGRAAAVKCAEVLGPGRAFIANLPLKDANEMLVAGRTDELIKQMWEAKPWRPDGIVTAASLKEEVMRPIEIGQPWPWEALTEATFGRRLGEIYTLGAGTGIGKTDVFTQIIAQTITELREPVGVFFLEQLPKETVQRIAGKIAGRRFHIPGANWTFDELQATWVDLMRSGQVFLYDSFGCTEWSVLKQRIKYLHHAEKVNHFFVDHLTALAEPGDNERGSLEKIMGEMGSLVKELNIALYLISHLATPEGKTHEEGGRVMIRHFKGSRAIGFWSHFMFGLERNQQEADETERRTTRFRILKDRYTGISTGKTFDLLYDPATGLLNETVSLGDGVEDF